MSISLGEKLRQAREERGISISEVAEQTRISSLYLKSIEDDNYKPLPGGIFNKGFVKAYAKYVGIDEQEALQDYAKLVALADESIDDPHPKYRPEVLTDDNSTSSLLPTIIFAGIILALMTGGILFVVNYIQNQPDTPAVANNNATNSNAANQTAIANTAPQPAANEIRVEFRALSEKVSVASTVDGTVTYDEVSPESPKSYVANESLKLRYYKGFANMVQISLNGKQLAAPSAPAKGNNVDFEINKSNVARIFESGQIVEVAANEQVQAQPTPAATVAATPATTPPPATANTQPAATPPRPAATAPPRRTPTPIIVGQPAAPRPTPN